MSNLNTVSVALVVSILGTYFSNRMMQPSFNLRFEPAYPMVVPAEQRPAYGDDIIAVKIETDGLMRNAIVRLLVISTEPDLSNPLNGIVEPTFGWPLGADSFIPRTIGGKDYIIVATEENETGSKKSLRFFFNEFYGVSGSESKPIPEIEFLKSLRFGTYYMKIALLSETTPPFIGKFKIIWTYPGKFEMSLIK